MGILFIGSLSFKLMSIQFPDRLILLIEESEIVTKIFDKMKEFHKSKNKFDYGNSSFNL